MADEERLERARKLLTEELRQMDARIESMCSVRQGLLRAEEILNGMLCDSARDELQRFKADPEVQQAYADSGHVKPREVVDKFNRLQEQAYPRGGPAQ